MLLVVGKRDGDSGGDTAIRLNVAGSRREET